MALSKYPFFAFDLSALEPLIIRQGEGQTLCQNIVSIVRKQQAAYIQTVTLQAEGSSLPFDHAGPVVAANVDLGCGIGVR
jgi:hypothetical protein